MEIRVSLRFEDEYAVPIFRRWVVHIVLATLIIYLRGAIVGIGLQGLSEVLLGLAKLHELVELTALGEKIENLALLFGDHDAS
jgi:hypothetical protein